MKLRADIFEAWVGGHIYERMQYDKEDPLLELRYFLNRLWSIRYRLLKPYRHGPTSNHIYIPSGPVESRTISPIKCKLDSRLKETPGLLLKASNIKEREIGYCV